MLDDIKESVRVSADVTIKTLSRICINMSEPAHGKVASNVTATVLPVLLKTGMDNKKTWNGTFVYVWHLVPQVFTWLLLKFKDIT